MELVVSSPRPLAAAAQWLEDRFHCVVTYEDAPCRFDSVPGGNRAEQPASGEGKIAIRYEEGDDLAVVIAKVLDAHAHLPGRAVFAVEFLDGDYHIVPRSFSNESGVAETRAPLMETTISVPAGINDGLTLLKEMIRSLNATRGEVVRLGTMPDDALARHRLAGGATVQGLAGVARDLLVGLFFDMGRNASWQMLNTPGTAEFVLNVHEVPDH